MIRYEGIGDLSVRWVELIRFVGLTTDVDFLICLIENAELLEKISLNPCSPMILG